jgi:aminoglycoside/choline kinase family phosphotransferase
MEIPISPEALTPEWLTLALHTTGTVKRANVRSFQAHAIGEVGGITGQLARVSLVYDVGEESAPHSLIAKFPAAVPQVRALVHSLGMYEREVRFYQQVAGQVELRTPRCYYSDLGEGGLYVLLLEDMAPARCGQEFSGESLANAGLAVRQIAKFHATWWENPRLAEMDWLMGHDALRSRQLYERMEREAQQQWEPFLEMAGTTLPQEIVKVGERVVERWCDIAVQLFLQPPRTLVHRDYGIDNLFFATPQGGVPFAVVDWQLASLGRGPYDVGSLLCAGMPTQERRSSEMDLLKTYHTLLVENGVQGYPFDQCLRDYRLSRLDSLARLIYTMPRLSTEERIRKFRDTWLPRLCAAILDLEAGELLPG